jgi:hypothetical protein
MARKLEARDWLALSVPAIVITIAGIAIGLDRGWLAGALVSAMMMAFTFWLWRRQMRNHPDETWRARL